METTNNIQVNCTVFSSNGYDIEFKVKTFKCVKCGLIKFDVDLRSVNLNNGYIHCTKCDSYYKLEYVGHKKFDDNPVFALEKIEKKEVMENLLNCENGKYTIIELHR